MTEKIGIVRSALDRFKGDRLPRGEFFIDREFLNRYFPTERGDYVEQLKIACESFDLDLIGIDIHDDSSNNFMVRNEYGRLKDFFTVALLDGPFNAMIKQNGFEEAMIALKSNPSSYTELTSKLLGELRNLMPLFLRNSLNGVALLDDVAGNQGLMMSRTDFENLIYPFYQSAVSLIRNSGLYTFFHSDGNILSILRHIADAGFDCFHCIDAQAGMDLHTLREVSGERITFMGHIDLFAWDEHRIILEIDKAKKEFACGGGILGSSCGLSSLIPLDRMRALYPMWEPIAGA